MKSFRHACAGVIAATMILWGLGEAAEGRTAARGGTVRTHGSVRHAGKEVTPTGPHSATVEKKRTVSTPEGTRTATRSVDVERTGPHSATVERERTVSTPEGTRTATRSADVHRADPMARRPVTAPAVRRIGYRLRDLPYDYDTVYVGESRYYYDDGTYYQEETSADGSVAYVVVEEPRGAVVDGIPPVYGTLEVDGKSYYTNGYVYYLRVYKNGRVSFLSVERP